MINDLSTPAARPYLDAIAPAIFHGARAPLLEASRDWTVYALAIHLYAFDAGAFAACHREYSSDHTAHFTEYRGKRAVTINATPALKERMRLKMKPFIRTQAGGARCHFEDYQNSEKLAYYVYCEGEVISRDTLNDDEKVEALLERSVVRLAAIFSFDDFTLWVKAPTKALRNKLCALFAEEVIGDRNYFLDPEWVPRFSFNWLRDSTRRLVADLSLGIADAWVSQLIVAPATGRVRRPSMSFDKGMSLADVHFAAKEKGVDLKCCDIIGVDIRFAMRGTGGGRFRTITLRNPNSTNLNDTPRDRAIRKCLRLWGLEAHLEGKVPPPAKTKGASDAESLALAG